MAFPSPAAEKRACPDKWSGLHERHRAVLQLLAVHERPLSLDVLRALPSPPSESALSAVQALPVVGSDGRLVWLEGPLQRFSRAKLQSEEASDMHLALAATFAGELHGDETNAWLKARELQEAHGTMWKEAKSSAPCASRAMGCTSSWISRVSAPPAPEDRKTMPLPSPCTRRS